MSTKKTKLVLANGALAMAMAMAMAGGVMAAGSDATASADVKATVLAPIVISKTGDLNFGDFAPDKETAGTVVIAADTKARSVTGGASLPTSAANASRGVAAFAITGDSNASFSITLPEAITLTHADGSATMSVSKLTAAVNSNSVVLNSGVGTGALVNGSATLNVGGTLTVAADQSPGSYSNPSGLSVTVAYN